MKLPMIIVSLMLFVLAAFGFSGGGMDFRANLSSSSSSAQGRAEWKVNDEGTRLRAELTVSGSNLDSGATLTVTIGSNAPFTVTTDNDGQFSVDQRFNTATRPTIGAGDTVTVTDASNTVVLSGVMAAHS